MSLQYDISNKQGGIGVKQEGMQTHFKKGVTTLCVLSLLQRRDMYGYELVQETERVSGGLLTFQDGTLYPVLYRLQEQGFISDHKEPAGKRMTRVYYHLTDEGADYLSLLRQEYAQISEGTRRILQFGEVRHETA